MASSKQEVKFDGQEHMYILPSIHAYPRNVSFNSLCSDKK
jgi:hypothetical protein